MVRNIARLSKGHAFKQRRTNDQRIGFLQEGQRLMLGPRALFRRSSPNGNIEPAAQLVMQSRRRCDGHLYLSSAARNPSRRGISQRRANVVGALTRRMWRTEGRPQASAAAIIRSKDRLTSAAKTRAAGVAVIRRPERTKRRWPSHVSRAAICRLTAPWVSPSSAPASVPVRAATSNTRKALSGGRRCI